MKLEFIKETKPDGSVIYYTEMNDSYVNCSLTSNKEEAYAIYESIKLNCGESKKEVLETTEL